MNSRFFELQWVVINKKKTQNKIYFGGVYFIVHLNKNDVIIMVICKHVSNTLVKNSQTWMCTREVQETHFFSLCLKKTGIKTVINLILVFLLSKIFQMMLPNLWDGKNIHNFYSKLSPIGYTVLHTFDQNLKTIVILNF